MNLKKKVNLARFFGSSNGWCVIFWVISVPPIICSTFDFLISLEEIHKILAHYYGPGWAGFLTVNFVPIIGTFAAVLIAKKCRDYTRRHQYILDPVDIEKNGLFYEKVIKGGL